MKNESTNKVYTDKDLRIIRDIGSRTISFLLAQARNKKRC